MLSTDGIEALKLTEQVSCRLRSQQVQGRTVHLKVRYSNFDTYTRSKSISPAKNATNQLWSVVSPLLVSELPDRPLCVRLLGMGVSNLQKPRPVQKDLFAEEQDQKDSRLDEVADQIRTSAVSQQGLCLHSSGGSTDFERFESITGHRKWRASP